MSRKETRHLHFNLSSSPPGVTHTLHLGHRKFELIPHSDESRASLRAGKELFKHIHDHHLTHHLPQVEVSAAAIQSYWISHPSPGRVHPTLAGCGIMIPKEVTKRAHRMLGHRSFTTIRRRSRCRWTTRSPTSPPADRCRST